MSAFLAFLIFGSPLWIFATFGAFAAYDQYRFAKRMLG